MAETPLQGRRFDGLVDVSELAPRTMIAVKGNLSDGTLRQAIANVAGDIPERLGSTWGDRGGVLWMADDELLLVLEPEADGVLSRLDEAAGEAGCLVADVSDMRAAIRMRGAGWRDVLAKLTPADVSPAALPPGRVRRSRLGQAAAAFWATSDEVVDVICFRSVAEYVFGLLADAARPDAAVGHHTPAEKDVASEVRPAKD